MFYVVAVLSILLFQAGGAQAQPDSPFGGPEVNIGINVPVLPDLVQVPGYPVYYNPRGRSNYFFYDGLYWVFRGDRWYQSSWYNGPWRFVGPEHVPLYVLRVPVRYYRQPPVYFHGWRGDAPPRWGAHWGQDWERRRSGWDRWDRHAVPPPAPLPHYQRQYSGGHYPRAEEQQHSIRSEHYRYQPHEAATRQHLAGPPDRGHESRPAPHESRPVPHESRSVPHESRPVPHESRPVPQERSRDARPAPQQRGSEPGLVKPDRGRESKPAVQERSRDARPAAPQERTRENKPAPQERSREARPAAPQERTRENKPAPQERNRESRNQG